MSYLRHNLDILFTGSLLQCVSRLCHRAQICAEYEAIINQCKVQSYIKAFYNGILNIVLTNLCID